MSTHEGNFAAFGAGSCTQQAGNSLREKLKFPVLILQTLILPLLLTQEKTKFQGRRWSLKVDFLEGGCFIWRKKTWDAAESGKGEKHKGAFGADH